MKEQRRGNFVESSISYQDFMVMAKWETGFTWVQWEREVWTFPHEESQENREGPLRKGFGDVLGMELYVQSDAQFRLSEISF